MNDLPVLRSRTTQAIATPPASENDAQLTVELRYAHVIARAGDALPKQYRGNDGAVLLAMHWGHQRGLDPLTAMQSVSFVQGRPVIDATMLRALARQAGYRVIVEDASNQSATVVVREDGEVIGRATFTMDDAKKAGLASKENWKNYAEDMLVARATARAIRRYAPDVMVGMALPDEVDQQPYEQVQPEAVTAQVVDPVEVDNDGGAPVGTTGAGSTPAAEMRGEILAMIDGVDDYARGKIKDWCRAKGWVLAELGVAELEQVKHYVGTMLPPEDEPKLDLGPEPLPVSDAGWAKRAASMPVEPEPEDG